MVCQEGSYLYFACLHGHSEVSRDDDWHFHPFLFRLFLEGLEGYVVPAVVEVHGLYAYLEGRGRLEMVAVRMGVEDGVGMQAFGNHIQGVVGEIDEEVIVDQDAGVAPAQAADAFASGRPRTEELDFERFVFGQILDGSGHFALQRRFRRRQGSRRPDSEKCSSVHNVANIIKKIGSHIGRASLCST